MYLSIHKLAIDSSLLPHLNCNLYTAQDKYIKFMTHDDAQALLRNAEEEKIYRPHDFRIFFINPHHFYRIIYYMNLMKD